MCSLEAQVPGQAAASAAVIGGGYTVPRQTVQAAPGQVMSLIVSGLDYTIQSPVSANTTPLPTALADFSVTLKQTGLPTPLTVPLLSIQQSLCSPSYLGGPCPVLTVLSLQIPFEVGTDLCVACGHAPTLYALVVSQDGVERTSVPAAILLDNVHVTSSCDTTSLAQSGGPCVKFVTHGNGTPVDALHPASEGEQLAIYALGLGASGGVSSGHATPIGVAALSTGGVGIAFEFAANNSRIAVRPTYVGLVPGFVAPYQINVVVPPGGQPSTSCPANGTNATMTILGTSSQDSANICVQP